MTGNVRERARGAGRTTLVAAGLLALLTAQALAVEPPASRKMTKQIEVLEQIIDKVLLDSPNFLIRSTPVARGTYIPDFGVLFTFDASLVGADWSKDLGKWGIPGFRIEEDNGRKIIIFDDDEDLDEEDLEDLEDLDEEDLGDWRDRRRRRQERVYTRGKTEMVDVLLDYGDTVTSLDGDKWIAIMAYLTDEDFIDRNRMSRLILKARVSDLRAYDSDDLSEEEMIKRIVEQEY